MKPPALTIDRRRDSFDRAAGKYRRSPITDYSYQSGAFGESSGRFAHNSERSFWNITGDYLKDEARRDFQSEAIFFAFISLTAALPLINNARALIEFARAIFSH
ncbi:MAG TPA: hypothetical protein VFA61_11870 [Candidatus Udaeobacter sp.]|nr:hypothetical protein [Candidatus Udaeobacter sp.]